MELTIMSESDSRILDLIDQGSYKYAQQLLDAKLKKFPNRSYYYALQNQILLKLGKLNQSFEENVKLLLKIPNDPQTLALMYETFNEGGHKQEANQVYEQVIKKYPTTSETLTLEWFDKSIDKFDLKLWNKIFINLSKNSNASKSRLYKFWNSFIYLSLIQGKLCLESELSLFSKLGLRIIEDLKPFENVQELFVYVSFLSINQEYSKVTEAVKQANLNLDLDMMVKYRDVLYESKDWSTLFDFTKTILFDQKLDDFNSWKLLIESGKELGVPLLELSQYLKQPTRNISLAKVELSLIYSDNKVEENVFNYYRLFRHKLCCFNDLQGYLKEIDPEKFKNTVTESTETIMASNPTSLNDLITLINNQKFKYILEPNLDLHKYKKTNWEIYTLYKDNQNINGGEFDNNPVNELNVISLILDLSSNPPSRTIITNIVAANHLLKADPYNHKLRLWLVKMYSNLNTNNLISPNYFAMKIKMLQHESLGHHLVNINPSKDNLTHMINIYQFYLTSDGEIKRSLLDGFDNGVFNKLLGFIDLGQRLNQSIFKRFVVLNILKFSIILNDLSYISYFINKLSNYKLDEDLSDNRDLTSEWKVWIFDKPITSLNANEDVFNGAELKLWSLRYLIIYANNASQHYKEYNKLYSNYKSQSPFKNLINQMYLNLFKIYTQPNAKDIDSTKNYLLKNMKFDKIRNSMIPQDILSWELNHNISLFVELSRIVDFMNKKTKRFDEIKNCLDNSKRELKAFNPLQQQLKQLDTIKSFVSEFANKNGIDANETFDTIAKSIQESWFKSI